MHHFPFFNFAQIIFFLSLFKTKGPRFNVLIYNCLLWTSNLVKSYCETRSVEHQEDYHQSYRYTSQPRVKLIHQNRWTSFVGFSMFQKLIDFKKVSHSFQLFAKISKGNDSLPLTLIFLSLYLCNPYVGDLGYFKLGILLYQRVRLAVLS